MKKTACALFALLLCLTLPTALAESMTLDGTLAFDQTMTLFAPAGGTVQDYSLRVGDHVSKGDTLMRVSTTKILAPAGGTVQGINAKAGDDAQAVVDRYGALCSVLPAENFLLTASTRDAYSYLQRDVALGQVIYLKCTASASRTGTARIIAISDGMFTAEVFTNTLRLSDQCTVYADEAMRDAAKIGSGHVKRTSATPVTGSGTILKVMVSQGDTVRAGDVLFETVDGVFAIDEIPSAEVIAPVNGVITALPVQAGDIVKEDETLLTLAPDNQLIALVLVDEDDLPAVKVGDSMTMALALNEEVYHYNAVIRSIGRVNAGTKAVPAYEMCVTFQNDDFVREGMTVTLTK